MKCKTINLLLLILICVCVFSACVKTPSEQITTSTSDVSAEISEKTPSVQPTPSTSNAPAKIKETQAKQYSFRTNELYESHFSKHGKEFGNITKKEYLQMANDLINSKSKSVLTKSEADGDKLFYDVNKNEFLVLSTDGYIRSFFKPDDGINYYNRQ